MVAFGAGVAYPSWPNLPSMMLQRAAEWPARVLFRYYRDGEWRSMTWHSFATSVAAAAQRFEALGIRAGDRVVIVSENRPEVAVAETALMACSALPVPAYTTNTVADHAHIVKDSGAGAAIVSTPALARRLMEAGVSGPMLTFGTPSWHELTNGEGSVAEVSARAAAISRDSLACLLYTSGTGGAPKGVMLAHRSILANCEGAAELVRPLHFADEVYLSFLPLSHSYEHTAGLFFLPSLGVEIAYGRGVEHLASDMLAVRPTIMTVVPRVLEVIRARILQAAQRQPAWKRALFQRALTSGLRRSDDAALSPLQRLFDPPLDWLARRPVRARFGGRLRAVMSGGARLEPAVGQFFRAFGIAVMQGYGQTEAGPVISANPPMATRIETVGKPLQGVELNIAPDGEILVRGELVMDGYWNRPEDTRAVLSGGWLCTGDVGMLDPHGYLTITDRKRDLIVLSGGENVAPARLENLLMAEGAIAQAVVFGDGQSSVAALVVAEEAADAVDVAEAVSRVNARLAAYERIRRHTIVPAFTIENGLMTPTQKVRRHLVLRAYATLTGGSRADRVPR